MKEGVNVGVPGTVEGYMQKGEGPSGDVNGVSWWTRKVKVPAFETGQRVVLKVESARQRTEVYVNGKLVGYDLVGNTPFAVDLTGSVKSGEECVLAFRVTDPGGNLDWRDGETITWGKYKLPVSHGFGGITGRVALEVVYLNLVLPQQGAPAAVPAPAPEPAPKPGERGH